MTFIVERIARWATGLKLEHVPKRVVDKAKLQFLSMMASVYSGFPTRAARAAARRATGTRKGEQLT